MPKCNKCGITIHDEGFSCADNCDKVSKKMTTKISLEKFAEKLSDHTRKDLIEMLYDKMSDDDLIEMAAEEEDEEEEPPACQTCKKPCWSNNDGWQMIHGCVVCQDCFDEHEKEHALEKKTRFIPQFNWSYSDGDERGCDIYGQWWVKYKPDHGNWSWDYKKCFDEHEEEHALEKKINLTVGA